MDNDNNNNDRMQKAASIFNIDAQTVSQNVEVKQSMWKLEKLKGKELRTWWDATTLKSYISKKMIPRGLRLKKFPTSNYSESFTTEWNDTLTDCSLKLMGLLVKQEDLMLNDLNIEIQALEQLITTEHNKEEYTLLKEKMETNLRKLEDDVMNMKKVKFNRDTLDYQKQQVYNWQAAYPRRKFPRSILKKKNSSHPASNSTSTPGRVNFSDHDTTMNSTAMPITDDSSDSSIDLETEIRMRQAGAISKKRNKATNNVETTQNWQASKNEGKGKGRGKGGYQKHNMKTRNFQQD